MPDHIEELKLSVNLIDNASAGLARLRSELNQISNISSRVNQHNTQHAVAYQSLGKTIEKTTKDLVSSLPPLARSIIGVGLGVSSVVVALGGYALMVKKWSEEITGMADAAKRIGVSFGQFRHITNQMAQFGLEADQSANAMAGLSKTVGELFAPGNALRLQLMRNTYGQMTTALNEYLDKLASTNDAVEQVNATIDFTRAIYRNAFEETQHNEMAARQRVLHILRDLYIPEEFADITKHIEKLGAKEAERAEATAAAARNMRAQTGSLWLTWTKIVELGEYAMRAGGKWDDFMKEANRLAEEFLGWLVRAEATWESFKIPHWLELFLEPGKAKEAAGAIDREGSKAVAEGFAWLTGRENTPAGVVTDSFNQLESTKTNTDAIKNLTDTIGEFLNQGIKGWGNVLGIGNSGGNSSSGYSPGATPGAPPTTGPATAPTLGPSTEPGFSSAPSSGVLSGPSTRAVSSPAISLPPTPNAAATSNAGMENTPSFAGGGIARRPSIVGEAGPEAVIPLSNKQAFIQGLRHIEPYLKAYSSGGIPELSAQMGHDVFPQWVKNIGRFINRNDISLAIGAGGTPDMGAMAGFMQKGGLIADFASNAGGAYKRSLVSDADRRGLIDRAMGDEVNARVEGTGNIHVKVGEHRTSKAPDTPANLFKAIDVTRPTQMEPAQFGPVPAGS